MTRANYRGSQRGHYARTHKDEAEEDVTLTGCTIGRDSPSGKAILVTIPDHGEMWMPISQIRRMDRTTTKGNDTLVISAWIAREKGLT